MPVCLSVCLSVFPPVIFFLLAFKFYFYLLGKTSYNLNIFLPVQIILVNPFAPDDNSAVIQNPSPSRSDDDSAVIQKKFISRNHNELVSAK